MNGGLVTVVIPAHNEESFITNCVRSLQAQEYDDLQIIVVDGASTDNTANVVLDLADEDPRIELIDNPRKLIPVSLNRAVDAAKGRWLVRVDAHSTVPADYVGRAVEHLSTGDWGGVGGRKDGVGRNPTGDAIAVAMGSRFGVGNSTYHHGVETQIVDHIPFGCYPVEVIRSVGGWDENLAVNQDFEFDQRVRKSGHELLFDPDLRIDWHCRQTLPDLYRQYRRYGRGKTRVFRLHPDSIKPRQVTPAGVVAALVGAVVLAPRWPRVSAAVTLPYAAFLAAGTIAEHRNLDSLAAKVRLPGAFAAMHLGFGEGLWRGVAEIVGEELSNAGPTDSP